MRTVPRAASALLALMAAACAPRQTVTPTPSPQPSKQAAAVPASTRPWVDVALAELPQITNPHSHHGVQACAVCHRPRSAELVSDELPLCTRCHARHQAHSHPVGAIVKLAVPPSLPLDSSRRLQCHTCHDSHDPTANPARLRLPDRQLCAACHPDH